MTTETGHLTTNVDTANNGDNGHTGDNGEFQRVYYTRFVPNPAKLRRQILVDDRFLAVAASIKEHGVVEPLIGIPRDQDDRILLICGHVRRRAVEYLVENGRLDANHPHCWLPVLLEPNMPPDRQASLMFVENEHRIPLSPVDEGLFYQSLLDQGWTKAKIAFKLEVSQAKINNRLDIVALDEEIQSMFVDQRLPLLAAGPLRIVHDPKDRLRLARMLAGRNLALDRIRTLCGKVAEQGIDALLNKPSPNGRQAHTKPAGNETRRLPPDRIVGLAALRVGVLATCRECDAAPAFQLPDTLTGEQINTATEDVCRACNVRDLVDACGVCPLVAFLESLEVEA